jgi:hypothetical protein
MSIREIGQKIKGYIALIGRKDVFTACIIAITGTLCFLLGMMYEKDRMTPPVTISGLENGLKTNEKPISATSYLPKTENTASVFEGVGKQEIKTTPQSNVSYPGAYVASKNSNKFHLPWCSGALRISDANKIWFQTKEEAIKKGYEPASNCKGM